MGGTIELESQLNVGTTFTITIPFEIDASYEEREEEKREISEKELSGVKVLLAEDNELNMEIAVFILEKYGMEVEPARNGKEAVDLFASSRNGEFQVILMDVMMPGMDGLTATREIRTLPRKDAGTIPIFAMTANAFADDIRQSKEINFFYDMDRRRILRGLRFGACFLFRRIEIKRKGSLLGVKGFTWRQKPVLNLGCKLVIKRSQLQIQK